MDVFTFCGSTTVPQLLLIGVLLTQIWWPFVLVVNPPPENDTLRKHTWVSGTVKQLTAAAPSVPVHVTPALVPLPDPGLKPKETLCVPDVFSCPVSDVSDPMAA